MSQAFPLIRWAVGAIALVMTLSVQAASTDISNTPLIVASPNAVKPNLIFVLDDSGSMDFDYLPDHANDNFCRGTGAGLTTGANYSGTFTSSCCPNGDASGACYLGNAPFGAARGQPPFLSASFNGVAYNPAIRYLPPVNAAGVPAASQTSGNTGGWTNVKNDAYNVQNTGSINLLTQYPDTEWCVDDGSFSDCLRNDNYVLPGTVNDKAYTKFRATTASGSGNKATGAPDNASVTAQAWGPHYYNIVPSEYCDDINLRNCQSARSAAFNYPAPLRWCNSDANARAKSPASGTCQAVRTTGTNSYSYVRYPTKYFDATASGNSVAPETPASVTFTFNAFSCTGSIKTAKVNGTDLIATPTASTNVYGTLGNSLRDRINAGGSGYTAVTSNSGRTIKITAPTSAGAVIAKIVMALDPANCNITTNPAAPAFSGYAAGVYGGFGGKFERVDIVPGRTSYPRADTRLDCTANATSCSYAEEMTNFANWWTYYHSRMQTMKTSASLAFGAVSSGYRVGYMSINNNRGNDFLNPVDFDSANKPAWFSRLTNAKPSASTPLRTALSRVGRLYGGRLNGDTLNGTRVVDPMQYSCQRNFTILSTDGFWNETANPYRLDGSTQIGDQDSELQVPMKDGTSTGNTLSDVAAYYYNTDSRVGATGSTACKSSSGADLCGNDTLYDKQRMVTFTLGLGASGSMQFRSNYLTAESGDYFAVAQGSTSNAAGGICTWQTTGDCTWPQPVSNTPTTIDDLWHAAVNGGGTYFSAGDPSELYTGLSKALLSIDATVGAAAAATTSNPNVTAGDNQVFVSNFVSGDWSGDLRGQRIDVDTGVVNAEIEWSARDLLTSNTGRVLYTFDKTATGTDKGKEFSWATLTATEKGYFQTSTGLTQFCNFGTYCLTSADQAAALGQPMFSFIIGERINEGSLTNPSKYFRERAYVLGDIVNSEATYFKLPQLSLTASGYADYKAKLATDNRPGMVYVGANDGMMHAFYANNGVEAWAYVPSLVMPKLYKLADKAYATQHQFLVDGSPVVQDAYFGGAWRTLLVAGLGAGGRGYYALDVTVADKPKVLWEFSDDNLGLAMGKAEIAKLPAPDNRWVVIVPSGYNNVSPGDGNGHLYVLDAETGQKILTLDTKVGNTPVGNTSTPSGFGHIRAWADNANVDNSVMRVYGGDNLGNVWRFDINNNVGAAGYEAQRLATLKDASGNAQPISSRPEIGLVSTALGSVPMVYVGTGRYLGNSDLNDASAQTIYGIKDRMTAADYGDPRAAANKFVKQTLTVGAECPNGLSICASGSPVRSNGNPQPVDLTVGGGWYVDLPATRERVNTDPFLVQGTLVVNTNIIDTASACTVGGSSYINFFDYRTGGAISTANNVVSVALGNALATRPAIVRLPNNKLISVTRLSNDKTKIVETPTNPSPTLARRLSWRELSIE